MSDSIFFIMVLLHWQSKTLCWGNAFPNCCILGSKGGAVVRALASHQCGPGSNPGVDAIRWLSLLVVLSLSLRDFSPGTSVFPSPQKPTFPNSNSTRNQVDEEPLCGCATSKLLFIYLLFIIPLVHYNDFQCWESLRQSVCLCAARLCGLFTNPSHFSNLGRGITPKLELLSIVRNFYVLSLCS